VPTPKRMSRTRRIRFFSLKRPKMDCLFKVGPPSLRTDV
jgi:hypothetical protein